MRYYFSCDSALALRATVMAKKHFDSCDSISETVHAGDILTATLMKFHIAIAVLSYQSQNQKAEVVALFKGVYRTTEDGILRKRREKREGEIVRIPRLCSE